MVKYEINGKEYYFDGYLLQNMLLIKQAVEKKWDGVLYIGGYEGDGKSEFAGQLALLVDPTYCLDRCVFNAEQFEEAVENAEPYQAIVYDEAQDVFESTNRDKTAQEIKSLMTRIRKKQLYLIIVAPDFWRINKYMFIHRSRAFIRVYSTGLERGYFEYYNREKKHRLKIEGQRYEKLCVAPNFRGRYTHWFPLDQEAYEEKKDKATSEIGKKNDIKNDKFLQRYIRLIHHPDYTDNDKSSLSGVSNRQIIRDRQKYEPLGASDGVTITNQLVKGGEK